MINGKRVVALIPARGGSKRLPRKNILPLGNKPLIGWTIEAAQKSHYIDEVIISTDDQEIADVVLQFGIAVPELRPDELSTDNATTQSVLLYTLERFGQGADIVILLQPTSPLRNQRHIDEALELFEKKSAFSIISVTPCEHPPEWSNALPEDDSMLNFIRSTPGKRSQDLGQSFRLNGALYVYDVEQLMKRKDMSYTESTFAYKMKNEHSIDIDNLMDFYMAEFFLEKLKLGEPNP
ncbi:cytidylyltransferase domain-containing protein [Vibrio barjaei]|uniref:Cytidylyltransferase domain-containing protein n=1 Tax=Vibrio barjaei TaxID=1676683 RepID=A0ABW7IDF4_9VIBR